MFDDESRIELDTEYELKTVISENGCLNEIEMKVFYQKCGFLFKGQEVEVVKGRTLPIGSKHIIKDFFRYNVGGTYGHQYTDYVVFEDGSKISLKNVKPTCELFDSDEKFFMIWNGVGYRVGGRLN